MRFNPGKSQLMTSFSAITALEKRLKLSHISSCTKSEYQFRNVTENDVPVLNADSGIGTVGGKRV